MKRVLSICLALALAGTVAQAQRSSATRQQIPEHPSKLRYGSLKFEVPKGADHRHELSNGVPVYIVEDHDLPLVDIAITVRVGAFLNKDKPGIANMTGTMIRQGGTQGTPAEQFDERLDFLAANVSTSTGETSGRASLDCISGVLDESLDLFFEMLRTPGFQQDRLQVQKDSFLESMKQRNDDPAAISRREWRWLMRGREHFTGVSMTKAELDAISRQDLIDFHRKYWQPQNMMIAVSGDVTPKAVLEKLEARFKGWKSEGPKVAWPPAGSRHTPEPGLYRVEKDIPQGRVLIGHLGLKRKNWEDPDAFALAVMNDILGGGGFTSRLVKRIRSDEGLAYSAGSQFGVGPYWPGVFSVSYQSKSPTVAFAAQIAMAEIERMRTERVSDEELEVSKNSFIEVFPRRFENAGQIAGTFVSDEYNGRPANYWSTYQQRIGKVTRDDVLRVAKKYLQPDQLVMLIVGKWSDIEPGDPDGRAKMAEFFEGQSNELPLRDPLTLEPMSQ